MSRLTGSLKNWLLQRISAIYLMAYLFALVLHFIFTPPASYEAWRAWLATPWWGISSALFVIALLVHGWIGTRDILLDYLHPPLLRITVLSLLGALLLGCGFWALQRIILAPIA